MTTIHEPVAPSTVSPGNATRAADNLPRCRYCHKPIKAASWGNWGHVERTDFRHYAVPERVR